FYEGSSPYLALNSKTGEVSLTSDLADVTEDTTLHLTAMAKDNGQPPLHSTARVMVELRVVSLVDNVTFESSSYSFSLPENEPTGVTVGKVLASSGSTLYSIAYSLKKHTDVFSINTNGAILTKTELDKEKQEWKLQSESAAVTAELTKVFGEDVQFAVEERPKDPDSDNLALIISLSVIMPVVLVVLSIVLFNCYSVDRFSVGFQVWGKHNWADMDTGSLIWTYFFLISVCACAVSGNPLATSVINCDEGGNKEFGPVDEGFSGDVELATGIAAGSVVELVPYIFPDHLEFLELIFTAGETTATVRTKKPLDADVLIDSASTLYYSIMCDGEIEYHHTRMLKITDLNDNSPIFTQKLYSKTVSEDSGGLSDTTTVQINVQDFDNLNPYFLHNLYQAFIPEEKAAQTDDPLKTADAVVSVTVEDINDNAPVFEKSEYSETLLENSPVGTVVLNVTVIDLDQGGFVGTLQIIPESAPFSISSDGTVTVKDSTVLDRETTESFTFQLQSESAAVTAELTKVFGDGVQFAVVEKHESSDNLALAISLGVILPCVIPALIFVLYSVGFQVWGKHNWADMDTGSLIWTYFFLISVCVCAVSGNPIATSVINCNGGGNFEFGPVDEGFSGDVELVTGITAGSGVMLVPYIFPDHLEFLELIFTAGETSATVRTKKPLDADMLIDSNSTLYYSIMCDGEIKYNNTRTLKITDLNDNGPVFPYSFYIEFVSESQPVNTEVHQVKAEDADITPANNMITYSIEPPSETFMMNSSGALILKSHLNYTLVQSYSFTVTAEDNGGRSDTASVSILVLDFDNLSPYFLHNLYQAYIPEEQAAQADDPLKTADAVVSVTVEDINDNAPEFEKSEYSETLLENSPVGTVVLNVTVTDLDQGGFVGTLRIVPETAPFSISSDGTVTVKDSTVLDRETTESFTFQLVNQWLSQAEKSLAPRLNDAGFVGSQRSRKLQSESAAVTAELTKVFGEDVQFAVEERPKDPDSDNLALTISLGVIVPCVIILVVIFVLKRSGSFQNLINFSKKAEDQVMKMDKVKQDRQSNRGQRK
ncbi:cadherin EGF LAG seven-pass G-type receptor 2-like, partial [Scomber scombrus]